MASHPGMKDVNVVQLPGYDLWMNFVRTLGLSRVILLLLSSKILGIWSL